MALLRTRSDLENAVHNALYGAGGQAAESLSSELRILAVVAPSLLTDCELLGLAHHLQLSIPHEVFLHIPRMTAPSSRETVQVSSSGSTASATAPYRIPALPAASSARLGSRVSGGLAGSRRDVDAPDEEQSNRRSITVSEPLPRAITAVEQPQRDATEARALLIRARRDATPIPPLIPSADPKAYKLAQLMAAYHGPNLSSDPDSIRLLKSVTRPRRVFGMARVLQDCGPQCQKRIRSLCLFAIPSFFLNVTRVRTEGRGKNLLATMVNDALAAGKRAGVLTNDQDKYNSPWAFQPYRPGSDNDGELNDLRKEHKKISEDVAEEAVHHPLDLERLMHILVLMPEIKQARIAALKEEDPRFADVSESDDTDIESSPTTRAIVDQVKLRPRRRTRKTMTQNHNGAVENSAKPSVEDTAPCRSQIQIEPTTLRRNPARTHAAPRRLEVTSGPSPKRRKNPRESDDDEPQSGRRSKRARRT